MAVAVGQRCVVRIQITDINLRNAREIMATIVSPQGDEKCQDVSFDEVSGLVYATVDVNSVGNWSMWLGVRFAEELFYTPAFVFAEVEGDAKSCDAPYIVDVEVQGESVSVTPPKIDVDAVTRKEFEQLSKDVAGKVDKVEGKGLSTNDFTNEYKQKVDEAFERQDTDNNYTDADKALVQTIPNLATKNEVNTVQKSTTEAIKGVRTELEAKADTDGYYPSMSVGMADNLVGRGDVQDAQINFRQSAGEANIADHAARIERIKGNSVVYNQKCLPIFYNQNIGKNRISITVEGDTAICQVTSLAYNFVGLYYDKQPTLTSHKYLAYFVYEGNKPATVKIGVGYEGNATVVSAGVKTPIYRITQGREGTIGFVMTSTIEGMEIGDTFKVSDCNLIDLTQMFGTGNEPTSYEEYLQRKPMNIADEYAYNAGTLVDMKVDSLVSTSDNAYDYVKGYARVMGGQIYDCSYGTAFVEKVYFSTDKDNIVAEENAMTSENGKYTFPSDGYAVPYTTDGDVREYCVCLQHTYTKPHPAYQQVVKDLSFIGEAFPKGMRSAGSVCDEIRYNPTKKVWEKVERVGVRAYVEGDAEDNSVTTDGETTNYPLDNPTPTTIDLSPNFNLDYFAWDFGTEEAIASVPSAPFRADINYEPNAVDDLRWAVSEIRSLKAQIAQMQTSVTNLTE